MKKLALAALLFLMPCPAGAQGQNPAACAAADRLCIMEQIALTAGQIDNLSWKDKAYRELAKSYTYEGQEDKAIALIGNIASPDTKAMTIRGIGFAAADSQWDKARYDALFSKLAGEAVKIDHPPSHGIALTYIAMAQAFAGDDAGATATAAAMENNALRHKAFGESAEIQAERGDFAAAMASIGYIDDLAYRNKAFRVISKIFVKKDMMDAAYEAAMKIDNAYLKSEALQGIVNHGNPEEETGQSKAE